MTNTKVSKSEIIEKKYLDSRGKVIIVIILFIVMNILSLKYSLMGFGIYVILMLIISAILGIFFLMAGAFEFYLHRNFRISKYIGILCLICFSTIMISRYVSDYQADLSKEKAKVIVEALEKFKSANNKYPNQLSELVPEYLEAVPSSSMGWFDEQYDYAVWKDGNYRIYFPNYGGEMYFLDSRFNEKWMLTD